MTIHRKIGLGIIGLGVIMFFVGASLFTYRGNINPIVSKIGMFSFFFWVPTIILGTVIFKTKRGKRKINDLTPYDKK